MSADQSRQETPGTRSKSFHGVAARFIAPVVLIRLFSRRDKARSYAWKKLVLLV